VPQPPVPTRLDVSTFAALADRRMPPTNGQPPKDPRRRRLAALASGVAIVVVATGGTIAARVLDSTTVELMVDGEPSQVDTRGDTVGDVLRAADVEVGEHDVVTPAETEPISDGDRIAVRHAKPLTLVVDGSSRTVWVLSDDVAGALSEAGVHDDAYVSASRSRTFGAEGISLSVRMPKDVAIAADGATVPHSSTAATVGDLMAEAGVVLGAGDLVQPAPETPISGGLLVSVTRVTSTDVPVPFTTENRADATLYKGQTKVLTPGANGVTRQVWHTTTAGAAATPVLVSATTITAPVTRVVAVGTKPKPAPVPAAPASAQTRNWAALAACESGGNPTSVSANGIYYGLYQFSVGTWRGVGGSGLPSQASPEEQTARAQLLYARRGAAPWPECGYRL
jgi:uncharacterized protein YabE (DUF348 family)